MATSQPVILLLGLSGRLHFSGGDAKVLGRVLPEEAPTLRREVGYTTVSSPNFAIHVGREGVRILIVDDAHQLLAEQRTLVLTRAEGLLASGGALLLGVATSTDVAAVAGTDARTLELPELLTQPLEGTRQ